MELQDSEAARRIAAMEAYLELQAGAPTPTREVLQVPEQRVRLPYVSAGIGQIATESSAPEAADAVNKWATHSHAALAGAQGAVALHGASLADSMVNLVGGPQTRTYYVSALAA